MPRRNDVAKIKKNPETLARFRIFNDKVLEIPVWAVLSMVAYC